MPILGGLIKRGIKLRQKFDISRNKPIQYQKRVLRQLLMKARDTEFGRFYDFNSILNSQDTTKAFRESVPVFDYKKLHDEWWYRTLNEEENICWPGKVTHFALSSGTSGSPSKHIPVTRDMSKAIRKTSIKQIFALAHYDLPDSLFQKGILMLGGSTHLNQKGSYFEGDLSGISTSQLPFWFQHFYKPGRNISKNSDWNSKLEEITLNAPNWDIGIIVGVPAWIQLLIEKIILHHKLETIHDIWPNLTIYVHGGVSFKPYKKSFEKLVARPLICMETYLASEGFIAFQKGPDTKGMTMVLNNGIFFEFVPFIRDNFTNEGDMLENCESLTIENVQEGVEYALLLTTSAGAYRYLIGDVIKFVDKEKHEIEITGRTKHFLSLCGEHLSVDNMDKAIELLSSDMDIPVREYTVSGIPHDGLFAHKWYLGTDKEMDADKARPLLDQHLKSLNDDYRVERSSALKDIFVEVVPSSMFYDWMRSMGKEGGQNKFPRVLTKELYSEWEDFVKKNITEHNIS